MPLKINSSEFENEVLNSGLPVLADFYSDSCVPCKMISPILSQLENEYAGKIKIVKINANFESELAEKQGVSAVPTLILYNGGKEVDRRNGTAKKDELTAFISQVL